MQHNSRGDTERSGKRKSIGKRKLPDLGESSQSQPQRTISDLLSQNQPTYDYGTSDSRLNSSPNFKRSRLSPSPSRSSPTNKPEKMYNFSGSPPSNRAAFAQGAPGSNASPVKSQPLNGNARQNNFNPHTGARKLVVKNLRTGSRLNQESYFDKVWSQLDAALSAIFDGRKPDTSLEELYKGAENVCRQGRAGALAQQLQKRCKEHVGQKLRDNLATRAAGGNDVDTLRAVVEAWSTWHSRLVCA